jgi:hypothetical protein
LALSSYERAAELTWPQLGSLFL